MAELSYTQLDPSVLSELPQDLRDELAAMLPSSSRAAAHNKPANPLGTRSNSTAARLLHTGRHLGNSAMILQQQQQQQDRVLSEPGQEGIVSNKDTALEEPVIELWAELQLALQGLSASTETDMPHNANSQEEEQQTGEKFAALCEVVLQWTSRQVETNLEDVSYLLRRLVSYSAAYDMIQLGVARLVRAMQQLVKGAHGAKLQLQQPLI